MALIKRDDLVPAWSNFLNDFFNRDLFDWSLRHFSGPNSTLPSMNVKETPDAFEIEMAAPGMNKEDFKIELDNGMLTISSEKKQENTTEEQGKYTRREFSYQSFSRTLEMPASADSESISAKYENGILKVVISKKEEEKPKPSKQISIE
ncbi:Hsp20/alpha crystallin family protein [Microbacter margulisiae]|uniref:HSP20 family protein n=1 Tax=Microbacter margulisiae TaxID=1350067 RepID=A0A7W5DQI0_9PORP|nr:Hsp20/alpha crystallin family protein [Microbacter margulisiae]MBB3187096.1 HSP20 family protein [Microbacter margulisiae]